MLVRDRTDLHNLSQDSGLSYSPVFRLESPQLTIGSPIRCLGDNSKNAVQSAAASSSRSDKRRWSISGLFKRRRSEVQRKQPPTTQQQQHSSSESEVNHAGAPPPPLPPRRCARSSPAPGIFPHLRPDRLYPSEEAVGATTRLTIGYYYHPRYGYVREGSYYDQQINYLTSRPQEQQYLDGLSSRSSGVDSDLNSSLDIRYQQDSEETTEEEGEEVMRGRSPRAHSLSRLQAAAEKGRNGLAAQGRCGSCGSIARGRGRQGQLRIEKQEQQRQINHDLPLRPGEVVNRILPDVDRHLQHRDNPNHPQQLQQQQQYIHNYHHQQQLWPPPARQSPYIHTATHTPPPPAPSNLATAPTSPSPSLNTAALPPPPPPPRDPRRRLFFIAGANGRPVSYSFEHIAVPPSQPASSQQDSHHQVPDGTRAWNSGSSDRHEVLLPPSHRPYAYGDEQLGHRITLSDRRQQHLNVSRSVSAPTPAAGNGDYLPPPLVPRRNEEAYSYLDQTASLYVDSEPRSRKPVMDLSSSSSIYLDRDQHVLDADLRSSAAAFWAPHLTRLQQQQNSSTLTDSSPPDSLTDSSMSGRTLKTPNRDSAIVSNLSTPLPPNCDSQSVSSTDNNNLKSGKSSPSSSLSSKDSGCSESSRQELSLQTIQCHLATVSRLPSCPPAGAEISETSKEADANTPERQSSPAANSSLPGFSTQKRRSHFRAAMVELENIYQQIAQDEDLLDRAERRDLPTPHQGSVINRENFGHIK